MTESHPPGSIVVYPPVDDERLAVMAAAAAPNDLRNCRSEVEAHDAVANAVGFVGKITPDLLAAAERLLWVQSNTASLEHYVFPELIAHRAMLTNCRGLFGDIIAEHTFGILLSMSRNLHHYRDRWHTRRFAPYEGTADAVAHDIDFASGPGTVSAADRVHARLQDWSMLIVGVGGIGAAIATRAAAWGIEVAGVDPRRRQIAGVLPRIESPRRLNEIIGRFDVVIIAAPHTPETESLFDADMIARMKPGSRLINVGRGAIADSHAIASALESGHLAGVGLDVFDEEPLPHDHPLWTATNAIITPHVAACATALAERHLRLICDNLRRFASDQPLRNVVDKAMWY